MAALARSRPGVFYFLLRAGILVSPYLAARAIYGPGKFAPDVLDEATRGIPGAEAADSVLKRLLTARALIAVGLLVLVFRLTYDPTFTWSRLARWELEALYQGVIDGLVLMFFGPYLVLAVLLVLVALARREFRGRALRAARRPGIVAFGTAVVMVWLWTHRAAVKAFFDRLGAGRPVTLPLIGRIAPEDSAVWSVFLLVIVWFGLFFLIAAFLVHRNGLGAGRGLPLLPPLVTVGAVWMLVVLGLTEPSSSSGLTGWRYLLDTYATSVAATVLAIAEIIRLRRRYGIGFRVPFPSAQPAAPDPPAPA